MTVGQALAGIGIQIGEHDLLSPPPSSSLAPGTHVYIRHAVKARLFVAGAEREVFTHAGTVAGLLSDAGVALEPLDRVSPRAETLVRRGMRVSVTTVRDVGEVLEEPIAFDTIYNYDSEVLKGRELLDQAGSDGVIRREYRVRLINGKEVRRELVSEVVTPSTDEIITIGTYVRPPPTPAPIVVSAPVGDLVCSRSLNVYATWYTAASAGGGGTTATGTGVYKGIVAVDPRVIPLGTRMYIPGYGYGLAADTGGGIIGNMIDLGYGADDVKDWRTHRLDICIL
jgi:3D (Asp-Asp-Asp) domain-containing protein